MRSSEAKSPDDGIRSFVYAFHPWIKNLIGIALVVFIVSVSLVIFVFSIKIFNASKIELAALNVTCKIDEAKNKILDIIENIPQCKSESRQSSNKNQSETELFINSTMCIMPEEKDKIRKDMLNIKLFNN